MGMRSAAETPAAILVAFYKSRRWRQAALAQELGVTVETLLRSLRALSDAGMPLVRDDSDRPHVWWRVRKDWAPSGVLFAREQTPSLFRTLARSPRTQERDALLAHVTQSVRASEDALTRIEAGTLTDMEQAWLAVVEDAAARRIALGMRYFSTKPGKTDWRYVSVHRVLVGPPARFAGVCHRSNTLKWFRVENVSHGRLDPGTPYRDVDNDKLNAFWRESVDGYRGDGDVVHCSFVVRDPEARWVRLNMLSGMRIDPDETVRDGVRVHCSTSGVLRVARFVVGLGEAARVETPELAAWVREIARGALTGAGAEQQPEAREPRKAKALKLRRTAG